MKWMIFLIILLLCFCERSETVGRFARNKAALAKFDLKNQKLIFDFAERINFASLRNRQPSFDSSGFGAADGLFIDFGATDYFKYALGGWNTGWGENGREESVTFTQTRGDFSQIFFPALGQDDLILKIRMRPEKSKSVAVYVNNHPIGKIDFIRDWWKVYSIKIGRQMLARGENRLLFKWDGVNLKDNTAAAVDYVYFAESDNEEDEIILPKRDLAAGRTNRGGKNTGALILRSGFALTYYIQIPEERFRPKFAAYLKLENAEQPPLTPPVPRQVGEQGEKKPPLAPPILTKASEQGDESCDFSVTMEADLSHRSPPTLSRGMEADGEKERVIFGEKLKPEKFKEFRLKIADLGDFSGKAVKFDIGFHCSESRFKLVMADAGIYVSAKPRGVGLPRGVRLPTVKNVIFIMIDTQRADHLAAYGISAPKIKTPEFDCFAKQGILFERFSSAEDWTKPSVATMLTGAYPLTHKAQTEKAILSDELKLLPQILQDKGLRTGAFIANAYIAEKFGFNRGWDYYTNHIVENKKSGAPHLFGAALDWIKKNGQNRYFVYIHTIDVHSPYTPPEHFLRLYDAQPYKGPIIPKITHAQIGDIKTGKLSINYRDLERLRALYKGDVTYHDKYLGNFLQSLESLGFLENTLVIITADHGEEFEEHGSFGHGHSLHQELTHVPLVMVWKGAVPKGKRIAVNSDHAILAPTVIDALGFDIPAQFEGKSIFDSVTYEYPPAGFSTHKDYKMSVWSNNLKFLVHHAYGKFNFFICDTNRDPSCSDNIYKKNPILFRYLGTLLGNFLGAPDKRNWRSSEMLLKRGIEIKVKEVQWDDELKEQLKPTDF